jgi:hypothetical protein
MVDADLLEDRTQPTAPLTKGELLTGLLQHELVQMYRYADNGPPPEVAPDPEHPNVYDGWAVVSDPTPTHSTWQVVYRSSPSTWTVGGVIGNAVELATHDASVDVYRDIGATQASERRRADALASQVAEQALGADIYVTERSYLHVVQWPLTRGLTVCTVEDALPLLGLYFRAQHEYPVGLKFNFNHGLFYWVGTRELLPEAWRWYAACVQHGTGTSDDSIIVLGGSLLQRVQRALEARDAVHVALNQPQNNDTRQEALSHLDVALVFLMGAVDVAARVVHRVLALPPGNEHRAAWQNQRLGGWLDQVRAVDSKLAAVVDTNTTGANVLTILRLLRNSVHGASLQGLAVVQSGAPLQSLVGLPPRDEADLLASMDALGGRTTWGVRHALPGRVHVDPGVFVDRLFVEVVLLLNDLMANTPMERLGHVSLSPADCIPPPPAAHGQLAEPFEPWIRTSIRWQLGF